MDIQERINLQFASYRRGLLTNCEMLENIIKIATDAMPRRIECRKGNNGKWKPFSYTLYDASEVGGVLDSLIDNTLGYQFRAVIAK